MGNVHFVGDGSHQLDGAEGTGHDAGAQRGQVEEVEHRMVHLGDEHGGYAVEGGAAFFMYRGEYHERVEFFHHHLSTAVGEHVHGGQYHAEAVEEGDAAAEFVVGGEAHALAGEKAVVGDVVVGEHHAFGEAGGA